MTTYIARCPVCQKGYEGDAEYVDRKMKDFYSMAKSTIVMFLAGRSFSGHKEEIHDLIVELLNILKVAQ